MSVGEDEAEQFSLRWNNFHNNLTHGFHELLEEEDLVDVTLACDGKYVQAHKIVLSVCSPYFKSLFRDNPCRHPIVILKDVGHKELQAILQFMYRGEVNVRQDDLTGFLKTAEMLKIKGLTGENNDKDSQKRSLSEEKRRPRGTPAHCDDDASPIPFKRVKQEQRRSRVVTHSSSRAHSPVECIPPSSVDREELMQSEFDVTKPKEEPVDYSQAEEYSSELGPSIPHDIEEDLGEVEEEVMGEELSEVRPRGSGRNHLPSEGPGGGVEQPPSALAAMAHLVHAGGPSGSEGQRQDTRGMDTKHLPPLALPSMSGAVMEPNVTLKMDSKEMLQGPNSRSLEYPEAFVKYPTGDEVRGWDADGTSENKIHHMRKMEGMFPGSSGHSQDSSSSQDISQGLQSSNGSALIDVGPAEPQRHLGYKCSICHKYFTRRDHLKTHTKNLHGEDLGPFACIICSQLYKNADSLRKHIGKYHIVKCKDEEI